MFWLNLKENKECLAACNFLQARLHALAHMSFWSSSPRKGTAAEDSFWRETEFLASMQLFARWRNKVSWLHVHSCQNHHINYLLGIFLCNGRSLMQWILCNDTKIITTEFLICNGRPLHYTQEVVLQVWLLDARWTTWKLCIEAKNNSRAFSMCKMFFWGVKVFLGNAR